jgi:pyruvate-formate lyase-activating enzyme
MPTARGLLISATCRLPVAGLARYVLSLAMSPSRRKLVNLVRCEWDKRRRSVRPSSLPYVATIDVNDSCGLRCPYCLTGQGRRRRPPGPIDLAYVRQVAEELGDVLLIGNIGNWGEPLMSPVVAPAIEILHARRIFTSLSSNLNIPDKAVLDAVCRAGLDYLIMSIDGASQETYSRYRRGGRLDRVLENVRHLVAYKRASGVPTPVLEWQYLVFQHNRHEVEAARRCAEDCGVDVFRAVAGVAPPGEEVPARGPFGPRIRDDFCQQLWHCIVVQADGGVTPCCYLFERADDLGSIEGTRLVDIRQDARFVMARSLFRKDALSSLPADLAHPCLACVLVHRQEHLAGFLRANPHTEEKVLSGRFAGSRIGA